MGLRKDGAGGLDFGGHLSWAVCQTTIEWGWYQNSEVEWENATFPILAIITIIIY